MYFSHKTVTCILAETQFCVDMINGSVIFYIKRCNRPGINVSFV